MSLTRKLLVYTGLIGSLSLGCKMEGPVDVNLGKQPGGELVGRVMWDPDGDGSYEGASGAGVSLGGGVPYGSCAAHTGRYLCEITSSDGGFSFHDIPEGTYRIVAGKIINNSSTYGVFDCFTDVTITKQNVTQMGNLKMKHVSGSGSGGSCR